MFKLEYNVLGSDLQGVIVPCKSLISRESDFYPCLKKESEDQGWFYNRVETTDQRGFPDILVLRGEEYWLIEVKRLHKSKLVVIEDDLSWQFGQIAFLKTCYRLRINYLLIVATSDEALVLKGAYTDEHTNYPDFIEYL